MNRFLRELFFIKSQELTLGYYIKKNKNLKFIFFNILKIKNIFLLSLDVV